MTTTARVHDVLMGLVSSVGKAHHRGVKPLTRHTGAAKQPSQPASVT